MEKIDMNKQHIQCQSCNKWVKGKAISMFSLGQKCNTFTFCHRCIRKLIKAFPELQPKQRKV